MIDRRSARHGRRGGGQGTGRFARTVRCAAPQKVL